MSEEFCPHCGERWMGLDDACASCYSLAKAQVEELTAQVEELTVGLQEVRQAAAVCFRVIGVFGTGAIDLLEAELQAAGVPGLGTLAQNNPPRKKGGTD